MRIVVFERRGVDDTALYPEEDLIPAILFCCGKEWLAG